MYIKCERNANYSSRSRNRIDNPITCNCNVEKPWKKRDSQTRDSHRFEITFLTTLPPIFVDLTTYANQILPCWYPCETHEHDPCDITRNKRVVFSRLKTDASFANPFRVKYIFLGIRIDWKQYSDTKRKRKFSIDWINIVIYIFR